MLTKIAKDFRWEMAHRLPTHEGGCRNIHGHGYRMTVVLLGEPQANGMVLDYFDLKSIVDPFVQAIDHAFLCDESDELMREFLISSKLKVVFVDFPTTAENIARWFYEKLADIFMPIKNLHELSVRVEETERTYAEVAGDLRVRTPDSRGFAHQSHSLE